MTFHFLNDDLSLLSFGYVLTYSTIIYFDADPGGAAKGAAGLGHRGAHQGEDLDLGAEVYP